MERVVVCGHRYGKGYAAHPERGNTLKKGNL